MLRPKFLNQREWFEIVVRDLLEQNIKPTPTELSKYDESFVDRNHGKITLSHGRLGAIRRRLFIEYGWWFSNPDRYNSNGLWHPPNICDVCGDKVSSPSFQQHNHDNFERHVRISHSPEDAERIIAGKM